jgi:hypothetical protein
MVTASFIKQLIDEELSGVTDVRVQRHVRSLLVEPDVILRAWDYGEPGQQYSCWDVLKHTSSNTGICYCEQGFGPTAPWGLVFLSGRTSMGMDSGWYPTIMEAYFESFAAADLPIWRVFKGLPWMEGAPISEEMAWDAAWKQVEDHRLRDPESIYLCHHTIEYRRANHS